MEPFESRFFLLRFAVAILLTVLVIFVGSLGIVVTNLHKYLRAFLLKLADFVPSTNRKYGKPAFAIAIVAVLFAEIAWVNLGGHGSMSSFWGNAPFILVYWAIVAALAVPIGIGFGFLEVAKNKRK